MFWMILFDAFTTLAVDVFEVVLGMACTDARQRSDPVEGVTLDRLLTFHGLLGVARDWLSDFEIICLALTIFFLSNMHRWIYDL